MIQENLVKYFQESIRNNWKKPALSDFKGISYSYGDVGKNIAKIHQILNYQKVKKGDKIALIGKNSTNWGIYYIAIVSFGAVVVPILPDFMPEDIHHIVNHSDSVLFFSSEQIFQTLDPKKMIKLPIIFSVENNSILFVSSGSIENEQKKLDKVLDNSILDTLNPISYTLPEISNNELALISYTSGTTGNSKGVMLLHNSLAANVRFAQNNMPLKSGDSIVSFLPLAHTYGMLFEFLFPFTLGCHITFLTKTPSPQIITQAFKEVKPRLILSVPLIIEKIYKKKILPTISKPLYKFLLSVPGINKLLHKIINIKLTKVFGGNFHEVVIGGAPFNSDAEKFLKKIKFPFTVGYGMTECGPLISYASWDTTVLGASGRSVDTLQVKIESDDPQNVEGEICVKGENVMAGYYKNKEASESAIDKEGWLHTGDLGILDKAGNIHIKGRSKTMILGSSGQNIFPEEIESILNTMEGILESLVIEENGKLTALIYPDLEFIGEMNINSETVNNLMKEYIKELNQRIPAYMNISKYKLRDEDFVKTPKRNIKRFLYTQN